MKIQAPRREILLKSRFFLVLLGFLGVTAFLLVLEHRAHIPGDYWLLLGLFALCMVMHRFMHGAHGVHGHRQQDEE